MEFSFDAVYKGGIETASVGACENAQTICPIGTPRGGSKKEMDDWENELKVVAAVREEEEDIADAWDASSEEEKEESSKADATRKAPTLTKRQIRMQEAKTKTGEEVAPEILDEDERERQMRLSDLRQGIDLLGVKVSEAEVERAVESGPKRTIKRELQSQKDIDDFVLSFSKQITALNQSRLFPQLLEAMLREMAKDREVPELRRLQGILADLVTLRQKRQSSEKKKNMPTLEGAGKKHQGRVSNLLEDEAGDDFLDDY